MAAPIEFYFDFSSPFGYLASEKIEALAAKHGREVTWRPCTTTASFMAPSVENLETGVQKKVNRHQIRYQ